MTDPVDSALPPGEGTWVKHSHTDADGAARDWWERVDSDEGGVTGIPAVWPPKVETR